MKDFLNKYNITEDEFARTQLKWKDLESIKSNYVSHFAELEAPAKYLIDIFHQVSDVHSVRYRLKSPDKLISKIIRKKIKDPKRLITLDTYRSEITDLIGIRVLHLFKEDWESIHKYIMGNWELHEDPIAYYREGDSSEHIKGFENLKCKVEPHPFGYRSIHYLIKTKPNKTTYIAEIQVRTIFEEAWSEIDHTIRYPNQTNHPLLNQFLVLFNRLAGSADEMGSFVSRLKDQLIKNENEYQSSLAKKVQIIDDLKQEISELKLKPKQVSIFDSKLDEILQTPDLSPAHFTFDPNKYELPDFTNSFSPNNSIPITDPRQIDIEKLLSNIDWDKIKNSHKNRSNK